MMKIKKTWHLILLLYQSVHPVCALHLSGKWVASENFKFLTRFGFQQCDQEDKTNTQGYIYGNITTPTNASDLLNTAVFVVVDGEYFLDYYSNRDVKSQTPCHSMFSKIEQVAWDAKCNNQGQEDFLRKIPCPVGSVCEDESYDPKWVLSGRQFTFRVQDTNQPR